LLYQPFPMVEGRRAQIWRYAPEFRRPRHFHDEPELNLVVAGRGVFGSGSERFVVAAGDLLCWAPGRDHELIEASLDFDLYVVALTPELHDRVVADAAGALAGPPRVALDRGALSRLEALCARPLHTLEASSVESHVAGFWREAQGLRRASGHSVGFAERVLGSLLERPELGRDARARLVRAAPSELSRQFRREFGLTLTEYRTRLRLLRFVRLADTARCTLLAAALDAGFGSYSQCHRAFQRAMGCTPRAFFTTDVRRELADRFAPWTHADGRAATPLAPALGGRFPRDAKTAGPSRR
jgi:AraC-like DNA-binding protein/mannose-6-phosphate isomerase-like protein (cupin superfamily)